MDIFAWSKLPSNLIIKACIEYSEAKKLERVHLKNEYINNKMATYKKSPTWYRNVGIYYTREEAEAMYGSYSVNQSHAWWDKYYTRYGDIQSLYDLALVSDYVYVSNSIFNKIEPYYQKEMIINE